MDQSPNDKMIETLKAQLPENIAEAVELINRYYPDAQHHEHWVVDEVLKAILGDKYDQFIEAYESPRGEKGERWVNNWDAGVAP